MVPSTLTSANVHCLQTSAVSSRAVLYVPPKKKAQNLPESSQSVNLDGGKIFPTALKQHNPFLPSKTLSWALKTTTALTVLSTVVFFLSSFQFSSCPNLAHTFILFPATVEFYITALPLKVEWLSCIPPHLLITLGKSICQMNKYLYKCIHISITLGTLLSRDWYWPSNSLYRTYVPKNYL